MNEILELLGLKRHAGVHPPYRKLSADCPIEQAELPELVTLPLQQHIGAPAKALVKRGDEVKVGQLIGEAGGFVSAPVHATVSGTVKNVLPVPSPVTGKPVPGVVIAADGKDEWVELTPGEPESMSPDEMKARIK
ncbi:electron transporter RnfC, partial [Candidatus Acetothermia bacterium]